jgi:2-polyprenyl-3-methyl-5-hydroxy-6-metoxy-1,4-benzoquinol methylase
VLGALIDKIRNKFYYELNHAIGAIFQRQEKLNAHTANALKKLDEREHKIATSLRNLTEVIRDINQSLGEISAAQKNQESLLNKNALQIANLEEKLNSELLRALESAEKNKVQSEQMMIDFGRITRDFEKISEGSLETQKAFSQLNNSWKSELTNLEKRLKYPHLNYDYVGFEEHFYGNRKRIRAKHEHYLKYFTNCRNVLDIGCGNGALLQLFKQNGIKAQGIDQSVQVINHLRAAGIEAQRAEGVEYLRKLKDESLDGITCLHVIEHLHPSDMLEFLKLCFAKLKKGSYLALETPNAAMLGILNKGFFMDLTHVRPVHGESLKFILQSFGFEKIETFTHSSLPEGDKLKESSNSPEKENFARLNEVLFGNQDITIIAKK